MYSSASCNLQEIHGCKSLVPTHFHRIASRGLLSGLPFLRNKILPKKHYMKLLDLSDSNMMSDRYMTVNSGHASKIRHASET